MPPQTCAGRKNMLVGREPGHRCDYCSVDGDRNGKRDINDCHRSARCDALVMGYGKTWPPVAMDIASPRAKTPDYGLAQGSEFA
jgi:hypothetical protein